MTSDTNAAREQLSGVTEEQGRSGHAADVTDAAGATAAGNRGREAPLQGSGGVVGSGAGAGGGGGPEEYDSDPQGGGGKMPMPTSEPRPDRDADAPSHGSR